MKKAKLIKWPRFITANNSYEFEQDGDIEEFEGIEIKTLEGVKKAYAIGAGSWDWDEVESVEN